MNTATPEEPTSESFIFAHEIRSPLTVIDLALAIIQKESKDISLNAYFDIITQNSKMINDLVTDLLLSDKKKERSLSIFSLNHILEDSLEMAQDRILLKRIKVNKYYTKEPCNVMVDFQKIKIALLNIIVNAIEAMPEDTGELELMTSAETGKCSIMIRDNGIGMSKKVISHIFTPYYSRKATGLGVGLSNTYNIFQSNNATINVESLEGKGSCFTITFNTANKLHKY